MQGSTERVALVTGGSRGIGLACVKRLLADGFDTFVEVGQGRVLAGMMRAIDPAATALTTNDPAGIERAVSSLQG